MQFSDLNLSRNILQAITDKGYTQPTPIQEQSIPLILQKHDLLGCAQTGTGKTAAFAIPTLHLLEEHKKNGAANKGIKALIITPTRELAIQIDESFRDYGKYTELRHTVIFGGVKQHSQVRKIQAGVDILTATPGRLLDLINQKLITLQDLQIFTLDEADRMLDMGFINDIKKIIAKLPAKRQSLFFSATIPPSITTLANTLLTNPKSVKVTPVSSTADTITQKMYTIEGKEKQSLLKHILKDKKVKSALVFTRTKHGANRVAEFLTKSGTTAEAIHGNKSQAARQKALLNFKNRYTKVLVATDIAARGIDIDELSHVINYEIPNEPETYVHRIGRTGRAKNTGIALSFCAKDEQPFVDDIHKLINKKIPVHTDHPYHTEHAPFEPKKKAKGQKKSFGTSKRNRPTQTGKRSSTPMGSARGHKSGGGRHR